MSMDTTLSPIDVAQHVPFIVRKLRRMPPAVERALWLVAVGQVATEGEPTPVRARLLAGDVDHPDCPDWIPSAGTAGRVSVVLRELEERGVLVGYRGRGRRPHLWSFRPKLDRWQGFNWEEPVGSIVAPVGECFCRAIPDLIARYPGQGMLHLRHRARFQLSSRDHITPPGLFLVDNVDKGSGRAPKDGRPGANPVDTRDEMELETLDGATVSSLSENSENSPLGEEEESYALLVALLEHHSPPSDKVQPGTQPDRNLLEIAHMLPLAKIQGLRRHMDTVWGRPGVTVRVPSGARDLRRVAEAYLPKVTAAL